MKNCSMIDMHFWPKCVMENILRKIEELASHERTCSSQDLSVFLMLASGGFVHDGMSQNSARNPWKIFRMMSLTFSFHSEIYWVCDDVYMRAFC